MRSLNLSVLATVVNASVFLLVASPNDAAAQVGAQTAYIANVGKDYVSAAGTITQTLTPEPS